MRASGTATSFWKRAINRPEEILRSVKNGFFVTELIGSGVNTVTGDYSRGAVGMWIRDGELAFPVSEVTIASTLQEMLIGIGEIGNDLEFRGSVAAPDHHDRRDDRCRTLRFRPRVL